MGNFKKVGKRYFPFGASGSIVDNPEAGVYSIHFNPMTGVYVDWESVAYPVPEKIYGDIETFADRIIKTYLRRAKANQNTGVLLAGTKGDGKTLLAKIIANKITAMNGVVVSMADSDVEPEMIETIFNDVDSSLPSVCLIDEFEKRYHDKKDQQKMLTFVDGGAKTGILFIFTVNDFFGVDEHFINRPGRIRYFRQYNGINEDFIREYCADHLDDEKQVESIVSVSNMFESFSFDSLIALIDEMNEFKENAREAIQHLAIRPPMFSSVSRDSYELVIHYKNEDITSLFKKIRNTINPYSLSRYEKTMYLNLRSEKKGVYHKLLDSVMDSDGDITLNFHGADVKSVSPYIMTFASLPDFEFEFKKIPARNGMMEML